MTSSIRSTRQVPTEYTSVRRFEISQTCSPAALNFIRLQKAQRVTKWSGRVVLRIHQATALPSARHNLVVPAATGGREIYQPFRPPPSSCSPQIGALTTEEQLEILKERRGFWHEYAAVIPLLTRAGFTPSQIDEITGLTGVEQDQIVVASQVRASLIASDFDDAELRFFDLGGAELLYELRILSAEQRKRSALFVIQRKLETKSSRELARAVKDFDRRKNVEGWSHFSTHPGDCLAFSFYRKSKEATDRADVDGALTVGLQHVFSEKARAKLLEALGKSQLVAATDNVEETNAIMQVIRLSAEDAAPPPLLLPLAEYSKKSIESTPSSAAASDGPFRIKHGISTWDSWVAVPGWAPVVCAVSPVAVLLSDSTLLPNVVGKGELRNEPVLLILDKDDHELVQTSFFLVENNGVLSLKAGYTVSAQAYKPLGKVLLTLRPPIAENQDWD